MPEKITEFRIQASANASDSVPIETAHEDMIVSRDTLAKREGFLISTIFSTMLSWTTMENALQLVHRIVL